VLIRRSAALGLVVLLAACGWARPPLHGPDILYVATPGHVGVEMLKVAGVTAADVVYDLGSGDGRLVIAAARDFGARGVGVEIDAVLVQESREAAARAGVTEHASFLWQDLFTTDIRGATVVTLYLRDDVNLRLRPKLLRELRPGTRVVSHDFAMGDWQPQRVLRARGLDREHTIYLWLVPADVGGTWHVTLRSGTGVSRAAMLRLTQRLATVDGDVEDPDMRMPITRGRVTGDELAFTVGDRVWRGRIQGDTVLGQTGDGMEWTAYRRR
jgi:SAM-dependent methyltransferase